MNAARNAREARGRGEWITGPLGFVGFAQWRAVSWCLIALLLSFGCRGGRGNELVFAALVSRTGPRAPWSEDLVRGMTLAIEQQNARGGIQGRRLRLATVDDEGRDERVGDLMNRAMQRESPLVVFGGTSTVATERAAVVAQRRSVPFVTTASTARDLTRVGDFVFRTALTDADQASAMARYARTVLQRRRAAIAYRRSSILHLNMADAFARTFRSAGGEVVLRETFGDDDTEMVQLAASLRGSDADVVYVPAFTTDAARVAVAARHGHVTAQLLGSDGWLGPELRRPGADTGVGVLVTDAFAVDSPRAAVEQFVQAFRLRFHAAPGTSAALGYDAMRWVLSVANRLPLIETRTLRDALAGSRLDDAVAGGFEVDPHRALVRQASIVRIERIGVGYVGLSAP